MYSSGSVLSFASCDAQVFDSRPPKGWSCWGFQMKIDIKRRFCTDTANTPTAAAPSPGQTFFSLSPPFFLPAPMPERTVHVQTDH